MGTMLLSCHLSYFLFRESYFLHQRIENIEMSSPILSWQPYGKHKNAQRGICLARAFHLHNVCQTQT